MLVALGITPHCHHVVDSLCEVHGDGYGAGGLGVAIFRGITTYQLSMTYLGSLMIAAVALCCDILLGKLEKQITLRINGTLPQNRKHKN